MQISASHPLGRLFQGLVYRRVYDDAHVRDRDMADYIVNLLTDFADVSNLYRIRNVRGRRSFSHASRSPSSCAPMG